RSKARRPPTATTGTTTRTTSRATRSIRGEMTQSQFSPRCPSFINASRGTFAWPLRRRYDRGHPAAGPHPPQHFIDTLSDEERRRESIPVPIDCTHRKAAEGAEQAHHEDALPVRRRQERQHESGDPGSNQFAEKLHQQLLRRYGRPPRRVI